LKVLLRRTNSSFYFVKTFVVFLDIDIEVVYNERYKMRIKEHPLVTKYYFASPLFIDDFMNVTVDTDEFDRFMILLEKHNITKDLLDFQKFVDGKNEIVMGVSLTNELHTEELKYDILTFLMNSK